MAFLGSNSLSKPVSIGVPQSSCLGPLLYSLYANDLHDRCKDVAYADDTALISFSSNTDYLEEQFNSILKDVFEWCSFNRVAVYTLKTKALIFSICIYQTPHLTINNNVIEFVDHFKYLSITIDSKLKYQHHLDSLIFIPFRCCGISYRIRPILSIQAAKSFYYSFFYASVQNCISAWGGIFQCTLNKGK